MAGQMDWMDVVACVTQWPGELDRSGCNPQSHRSELGPLSAVTWRAACSQRSIKARNLPPARPWLSRGSGTRSENLSPDPPNRALIFPMPVYRSATASQCDVLYRSEEHTSEL